MTEEAREAELDGYIHAARELNRTGNELRDQGYAGRDTDMSLAPLDFLRLIETAQARGIRQAREAVAAELLATDVHEVRKPDVIWRDDALAAIDALESEK